MSMKDSKCSAKKINQSKDNGLGFMELEFNKGEFDMDILSHEVNKVIAGSEKKTQLHVS